MKKGYIDDEFHHETEAQMLMRHAAELNDLHKIQAIQKENFLPKYILFNTPNNIHPKIETIDFFNKNISDYSYENTTLHDHSDSEKRKPAASIPENSNPNRVDPANLNKPKEPDISNKIKEPLIINKKERVLEIDIYQQVVKNENTPNFNTNFKFGSSNISPINNAPFSEVISENNESLDSQKKCLEQITPKSCFSVNFMFEMNDVKHRSKPILDAGEIKFVLTINS